MSREEVITSIGFGFQLLIVLALCMILWQVRKIKEHVVAEPAATSQQTQVTPQTRSIHEEEKLRDPLNLLK